MAKNITIAILVVIIIGIFVYYGYQEKIPIGAIKIDYIPTSTPQEKVVYDKALNSAAEAIKQSKEYYNLDSVNRLIIDNLIITYCNDPHFIDYFIQTAKKTNQDLTTLIIGALKNRIQGKG